MTSMELTKYTVGCNKDHSDYCFQYFIFNSYVRSSNTSHFNISQYNINNKYWGTLMYIISKNWN